jgi:hypothetical protein
MFRNLVLATVVASGLGLATPQHAEAGSRPTYIRNGTAVDIGVWVDDGGRGLKAQAQGTDGRPLQIVSPNGQAVAGDTNLFDCPTIRVYMMRDGRWVLVDTRKLTYIPPFRNDKNNQVFNGTRLQDDK